MQSIFPEFKFHRGSTPVLAFSLPLALNAAKDKLIITFSQDYEVKLQRRQRGRPGAASKASRRRCS